MIYLADSATYRYTWSDAEVEQETNSIDLTLDAPVNVTCNVVYQPANYKSVEEVIDKIPADLSIYTDESVQVLLKAQEDVE